MGGLATFLRTTLILVNLLGAHSSALSGDDFQKCLDPAGEPDAVVTACSNFIQAPTKTPSDTAARRKAATAFFFRGLGYRNKGDPDRAIQDYDQAISIDPNYAAAYRWRAESELAKRDYASAITDFTKAIALDASYEAAYNGLGVVYDQEGDYDRAIQEYDQAARLDHTYAFPLYNRGNIYHLRGDDDRALSEFNRAVQLQPDFPAAFEARGDIYDEQGEPDRAIQDYDQAIKLYSNYPEAFNSRGLAYFGKGDLDRANQDFNQALELAPGATFALYNRGILRFFMSRYADAQKDFAAYLQIIPNDFNALAWLYLTQARANDPDARMNLQRAVAGRDIKSWPASVVAVFLGRASPQEALWAARDPDPRKEGEARCGTNFFLAEHALLEGDQTGAYALFEQAVESGATDSTEFIAAQEELHRQTAQTKP
jgi:lipoprotein NlpI